MGTFSLEDALQTSQPIQGTFSLQDALGQPSFIAPQSRDSVLVKAKIGPDLMQSDVDAILRSAGLTARAGMKGVTAIPAMFGNAIGGNSTVAVETLADKIGLPRPQTDQEKIVQAITESMAGSGGISSLGNMLSKVASPIANGVGSILSQTPGLQASLSGVSGGATEAARQNGVGPIGQIATSLVAPLSVGLALPIAKKTFEIPYNIIAPTFSESARNTGAARMANDVSGTRAGAVANALTQALPEQTAGQAALDTGSAEFMALQKILRNRLPSEYANVDAVQKSALKQSWKDLNASTEAIRNKALQDANAGGIQGSSVINQIDSLTANPGGGRSSKVIEGALNAVKERINAFTDQGGYIDARDLYDIRKKIGTVIKSYSKDNADWDKTLASGLERDAQRAIDSEIVGSGGGQNWITYLGQYSKEAKRLSALKDAEKTAAKLASQGTPEANYVMGKSESPIQGVNLLNRVAMIVNAIIKRSELAGGRNIEQRASQMMLPMNLGGNSRQLGLSMFDQLNKPTTWGEISGNVAVTPRAAVTGLLNQQE